MTCIAPIAEFDRAVQEELFDIKFIDHDFGEGLVTVFLQNTETCKTHTNPMGIIECSFLQSW